MRFRAVEVVSILHVFDVGRRVLAYVEKVDAGDDKKIYHGENYVCLIADCIEANRCYHHDKEIEDPIGTGRGYLWC